MPPSFDLARQWQPVASSLAQWNSESGELASCAASVLGEVEAMAGELSSRARELQQLQQKLDQREEQLNQQRADYGRLTSQFDQQAVRLAETTEELARLRQDLSKREPTDNLAANTAQAAFDKARELWQRDRTDVLERLNALTLMQQTGSNDGEAVQAFCHELTEVRQLIEKSQSQSRDAVEQRLAAIGQQLSGLAEASSQSAPSDARIDKLGEALAEVQQQLAALAKSSTSSADHDKLLKRLDALAEAGPAGAADNSPQVASILEKLTEVHAALKEERTAGGSSSDSESIFNSLRGEMESLRKAADEAKEQSQREATERTLVEAELDRVRSQAAQWRREMEEQAAHYHEEERQWHEELQDLRHLLRQAAASTASAPGAAADPVSDAKSPDAADPVANSLLAQFAKLQKDSARRRTRSQ